MRVFSITAFFVSYCALLMPLNAETTYLPTRAAIDKRQNIRTSFPDTEFMIKERIKNCEGVFKMQTVDQMDKFKLLNKTVVRSVNYSNNDFQTLKRLIKNSSSQDYSSMICFKNVCDLYFDCVVKFGNCNNKLASELNLAASKFETFKNKKQEIYDYVSGVGIDNKDSYKNEITHTLQNIIPIYQIEALKFV
ncbi:hypothetical protein BB561_002951 [Smittium simulii]|uniref:Uncharacterized protein n=1 Tax=Smittium simulii TaxID=133385 RepID=A0A2T9YNJ1_9FUNG|nr:hypothetical protein BB561_002951 [Smittium simulii]